MTEPFKFSEVIEQSTSDVAISELARKGFQRVKVLHRDTVDALIREAVSTVVEARIEEASLQDREKLQAEAKAEFNRLAVAQQAREKEAQDYREQLAEFEVRSAGLRDKLAQRDAEIAALQEQLERSRAESGELRTRALELETALGQARVQESGSTELQALRQSIEALASKISQGGSMGSSGDNSLADPTAAIESLFSQLGDLGIESNLGRVKSKKAKAGGVAASLNKLKSMQTGEE
ncbi:MAG: hypothetical protein AB7O52_01235 [Planctomycetota bacterium]